VPRTVEIFSSSTRSSPKADKASRRQAARFTTQVRLLGRVAGDGPLPIAPNSWTRAVTWTRRPGRVGGRNRQCGGCLQCPLISRRCRRLSAKDSQMRRRSDGLRHPVVATDVGDVRTIIGELGECASEATGSAGTGWERLRQRLAQDASCTTPCGTRSLLTTCRGDARTDEDVCCAWSPV